MRHRVFLALALGAVLAAVPAAAETKPKPTGVFSNLSFNREGGDLLGIEIIIVPAPSGYVALLQHAEGVPHQPVLIPVEVRGSSISFEIPASCPCALAPGSYSGPLSPEALRLRGPLGSTKYPSEEMELRRGKSYWQ